MGGRGGFIKESGFNKYRYEIVDFVDGVKVLEPRDKSETHTLPERSNSPCTSYMCYYKKKHKDDEDVFKQYIILTKIECLYIELIMVDIGASYLYMCIILKMEI